MAQLKAQEGQQVRKKSTGELITAKAIQDIGGNQKGQFFSSDFELANQNTTTPQNPTVQAPPTTPPPAKNPVGESNKVANTQELGKIAQTEKSAGRDPEKAIARTSGNQIFKRDLKKEQDLMGKFRDQVLGKAPTTPEEIKKFNDFVYVQNGQIIDQLPVGDVSGNLSTDKIVTENQNVESLLPSDNAAANKATLFGENYNKYLEGITADIANLKNELLKNKQDEISRQQELEAKFGSKLEGTAKQSLQDEFEKQLKDRKVEENIKTYTNIQEEALKMKDSIQNTINNLTGTSMLASLKSTKSLELMNRGNARLASLNSAGQIVKGNIDMARSIITESLGFMQKDIENQKTIYTNLMNLHTNKIIQLTADERAMIKDNMQVLEDEKQRLKNNADTIANIISTTDPNVIVGSGVKATDEPVIAREKIANYIFDNPQFSSTNQSLIAKYQQKYPDAGIMSGDSIETIKQKLGNSLIYQNDIKKDIFGVSESTANGETDPITGVKTKPDRVINGYDFTSFATDSNWANSIKNKLSDMGKLDNITEMQIRINQKNNNSPYSARNIAQASERYKVDWETLLAIIEHESNNGTSRNAINSNNFAGITWSQEYQDSHPGTSKGGIRGKGGVEGGNYVKFPTVQEGVDALAENIAKRKIIEEKKFSDTVKNWGDRIIEGKGKLSEVAGKDKEETSKLRSDIVNYMADSGKISKTDAAATVSLQDKVTELDGLIDSKYFNNAVGPSTFKFLSRFGTPFSAGKQDFIAGVEKIISKETLDTLINLKKAGGTLGALSEKELSMLNSAASKIGTWRVVNDNGQTVGYNASEKSFKKELESLRLLSEGALKAAGGDKGTVNTVEQILSSKPELIDEYNKIVTNNPNLTDDEILQVMGQ